MKIAIIGNCGSGKSTLALEIQKILTISQQLCDEQTWIIEGITTSFFEYRIQKADIIIFLDIPTYRCLFRVYKRALLNYGKICFSSAYGCLERLPDLEFLKFIVNFNRTRVQKIKELLQKYKHTKGIFVVRTPLDISTVLCYFKEKC